MAKRNTRFRKKDSDRSGFTYKARELVRDEGSLVGPDEYDQPPPDNRSLGGEGEISGDPRASSDTYTTPADKAYDVQIITASGGISPLERSYDSSNETINNGIVYIAGSASEVTVSANPQVGTGRQGQFLTIMGVGSTVTLSDGNGLSLRAPIKIDSGMILNLFYSATDNLWLETSRSHLERDLGAF